MAGTETDVKSDAAGLAAMIAQAAGQTVTIEGARPRGVPPVDRWEPPFCGDIDMEIRADGSWFYMGTPIAREALVRLFSTVLRRDEDGRTYLVTPVEKLGIRVEDAPFLAVEMRETIRDGEPVLTFRTNVGDVVEAGRDHALRFVVHGAREEMKPYLHVRGRLEALISRSVMYELMATGHEVEIDGIPTFAVRSGGVVFPVMPAALLSSPDT